MNYQTLISCENLHAEITTPNLVTNLVVVDCRVVLTDRSAGASAWREAHLPGAGFADLETELSDHRKPAEFGRHPLPDAEDFCLVLQRLGIAPDSQVVAYDADTGALAAARFWWLLRLLGHQRVAVLDGGLARWRALGLPLESGEVVVPRSHYEASYAPNAWLTTDALQTALQMNSVRLLDARTGERFRGEVEPLDKRAGHIPGAISRPLSENMHAGIFKSPDVLRAEFLALLGDKTPDETVLSCGSGVTACHNLLAMEIAGLTGAKIYPPSWSGWISDPSRPIAVGA